MSYVVITQTLADRTISKKHFDYVDASEIAWEIGYESIGDPEFVSVNVQCTICEQFNHHCTCLIPGYDPERGCSWKEEQVREPSTEQHAWDAEHRAHGDDLSLRPYGLCSVCL